MTQTDNFSHEDSYLNNININLLVKQLCKTFDTSRYYRINQVRKILRHIKEKLAEKSNLKIAKKISNLFIKNLPIKIYHEKVIGQEIIDHIENELRAKIVELYKDQFAIKNKNFNNTQLDPPLKYEEIENFNNLNQRTPIARVIPGSNTIVIKCTITETFQELKNINNKYVVLQPFEGVKVLGQLGNIYTVNATPNNLLLSTLISDKTIASNVKIIKNVDARKADVYIKKVLDGNIRYTKLGNAPPTGIEIYLAIEKDMNEFYSTTVKNPIKFVRTLGHLSFIPEFDLERILRRHTYALGITDAGKGYFINAFLASCVGQTINIAPNIQRQVGVLYFDFNGQYANDAFGFFQALREETGEDPREIINGDEIGVQTADDLIEIFFRKYQILDLGMASQKMAGIRRYLAERININSSLIDFQRELPNAIRNVYSGNPRNHIDKLNEHLQALTCRKWNEEIEPLKSPDLFFTINQALRNGRFVIINLSRIREREYKPGIVYRILKFLHENLNENFNQTQREMDFPVIVGIDEAHNFAPTTTNLEGGYYIDECNSLISRICAEDRKTGLSMVLITQRLVWMNRDVRANIGLWCVSKINGVDEDQLKKNLGNHDFVNYKYKTFHIFGDVCPIPNFPTKALNPANLAKLKAREGKK